MAEALQIRIRHSFAPEGPKLDVDFAAPAGVTALFGRSGAGKTSVARALAGLLTPQAARIVVSGRTLIDTKAGIRVPVHKRRIGMVFQDARLFPHLSVAQNLAFAGRFLPGRPDIAPIAALLGLTDLLTRSPGHLSGGEAQRVAIGRALLQDPLLLVMDEPLSSLDQTRKDGILPYLERLRDVHGLPILYVSHDLPEVARLADTLVLMDQGHVRQAGPAAELLADPSLTPLLGVRDAGAVLIGTVARHFDDGLTEVTLSRGHLLVPRIDAAPGQRLRLRVPAQDVILARQAPTGISALNILPVTITDIHAGRGPGVMVQARAGSDRILARVTRRSAEALALYPGLECYAVLKTVSVAYTSVGQEHGGAPN